MKQKALFFSKRILCPLVLFLLPLRHISQGIDLSDTGYNLAGFMWFGKLDGMWVYVTYLANLAGHLFTLLPMGNTMRGMNLYCSLTVSLIALCGWYFLRDKIPFGFVFAGEVLAILLCWCPHVILYNYLTYLALMAGTLLLYRGIIKKRPDCYVLAGLVLGLGVGVRFSNLTHMALIIGLWYYAWRSGRRLSWTVGETVLCMIGYGLGIGAFLLMIHMQYGLAGYLDMLFGLRSMSQGGASGYSTGEMLAGAFIDYAESMKWGALLLLYLAAGLAFFRVLKGLGERGRKWNAAGKAAYLAGFVLLIRLLYGRGMFGLDYHTYFSMFRWVSLFNTAALVCSLTALFRGDLTDQEKLLSLLNLITILILPLGSNNRSYPVINNLFLIAPMTLYLLWRFLPKSFPVRILAGGCLLVLFVQAAGFGAYFVFRDGSYLEKRDTKVENNAILKDMYTTRSNARVISQVSDFWQKEGLAGQEVILYGDIPGISYILSAPSAITSSYSNLESYNITFWERDFARVEANIERSRPVVMIGKDYEPVDDKAERLRAFMNAYGYETIFENEKIAMYH